MHALLLSCPVRAGVVVATLAIALSAAAQAQVRVDVTNLVTDDPIANPGTLVDAGLVNAWGIARSGTSPFWVSANGTDTASLYSVDPPTQATTKLGLTVSVPVGGVTGQVFNSAGAGAFNGDNFLFVGEGGAIAGWRNALGTTAETLKLSSSNDVYKGAAFATLSGNSYVYAANFRSGAIDILKGAPGEPDLAGHFTDPGLPSGYAPFNIQEPQRHDVRHVRAAGREQARRARRPRARFRQQLRCAGQLHRPRRFRRRARCAVGLGDRAVVVRRARRRASGRQLRRRPDQRVRCDQPCFARPAPRARRHAALDRWPLGLAPGNGGNGGNSALLDFSAGPDDESHRVFGVLSPVAAVPESPSLWLLVSGLVAVGAFTRRRRPS